MKVDLIALSCILPSSPSPHLPPDFNLLPHPLVASVLFAQEALVFIATKGGLGGVGIVQRFLDSYGVSYTGE